MKFRRLSSVLFWSIISAAFLGPGTVTTAAAVGAAFQLQLLWALTFSTIATVFLQEASARIAIASGLTLGEAVATRLNAQKWKWLLAGSVIFGCAAYQAGNILGAIAGIKLIANVNTQLFTVIIVAIAAALLWFGNPRSVAKFMGIFVALMGIAFFYVAFRSEHTIGKVVVNAITPQFPENSTLLIISLIGTTIVPYNLFLGSGISRGETINHMRFGLVSAVIIGGFISMAIVVASTGIGQPFSFEAMKENLTVKAGTFTASLIAFGLFAAGFTSSITAPLAASITAQSVFGRKRAIDTKMEKRFRLVGLGVLVFGLIFGVLNVRPVPVIILAQAANGILLPFVAIFLLLTVNDLALMGKAVNGLWVNIITLLIVGVTVFLGLNSLINASQMSMGIEMDQTPKFIVASLVSVVGMIVLTVKIIRMRSISE